jgi:N6-adenosine-specific RNA methylase IME4
VDRRSANKGVVVVNESVPLPSGRFGAILCDPPWHFETWSRNGYDRHPSKHYDTMAAVDIRQLPVADLAASDCVLFLWITWPLLEAAMEAIRTWGFHYKTASFVWMKAHAQQLEMFQDDIEPHIGLGYWTRSNSEVCLLATCGNPKRRNADVRQGIIAPRREHSRKPDGVHERIERLVAGPYLELFARQSRPGWTTWGNERTKFDPPSSRKKSWDEMWAKPFHRPEAF